MFLALTIAATLPAEPHQPRLYPNSNIVILGSPETAAATCSSRPAIETGYIQNEIQNASYDYQREIESGRRIVVGVNRFQQDERAVPTFHLDPALENSQVERLRELRTSRSQSMVEEKLAALEQAARGGDNLMPVIFDAASAYATVGEISGRLRGVFGEYREG